MMDEFKLAWAGLGVGVACHTVTHARQALAPTPHLSSSPTGTRPGHHFDFSTTTPLQNQLLPYIDAIACAQTATLAMNTTIHCQYSLPESRCIRAVQAPSIDEYQRR